MELSLSLAGSDGDIEICSEPWEPLHTNSQADGEICILYV